MTMININSKMSGVETSIFAVMTKLAMDNNALNLSQGFPDFNPPEELLQLVNEKIHSGFNQYAPMPGVPALREKISEKVFELYGRKYNPVSEITITAGATQSLYTAITTVINKDDEVIIFEPAYDLYIPVVKACGGIPVPIQLELPDFTYNWNAVKEKISNKTKLIIVNSPHNPTGSILTQEDINALEEITRDTNIIIISDEVYEHIIFDGQKHNSLSSSKELSERSFVISSFGKTYHSTGWKVGYTLAPEKMTDEFRKMHQFITFAVNTPVQHAYADFMKNKAHYLALPEFYQSKRDLLLKNMEGSRFKFTPTKSTYFQLFDYSEISNMNDKEFCEWMVKKHKVAAIPLSPFMSNKSDYKLIRICFAKKDDVLIEGAKRLRNI